LSGVGFAPLSRYWCLFVGPGAVEALQEATVRSTSEVECQKPLAATTAETHDLELSLYFSPDWPSSSGQQVAPLLAKRFSLPLKNWAYASLVSVTPDRGDSLGGTPLQITLGNNPLTVPGHAAVLRCQFSTLIAGSAPSTPAIAYSSAVLVDETHMSCVTPDFSAHFTAATSQAAVQEVYLSVSELDGTFRTRSELRFRYFQRPAVTALTPTQGFATRATQVNLHGQNFVNFDDLSIRAIAVPAGGVEYSWVGVEVLFMDSENLLIEMPAAATPDGRRTGAATTVRFEISLNGGVDWSTDPSATPTIFTFLDEPLLVSLSQSWANLRGGFDITLELLHSGYRASCPVPATTSSCAKPEDIAYCQIGTTDSILTHVDATHASCRVPPQAAAMIAPVALRTIDGQYFGSNATREAVKFYYFADRGIHRVWHLEGPAAGGQLVKLEGNFTGLPATDTLTVKFGRTPVAALVSRSETVIVVQVAAAPLTAGEVRQSVHPSISWDRTGLLFLNESVNYLFRAYPVLTGIKPTHGPSRAGTMIEVQGTGLDQLGLCRLGSAGGDVILIRPLWVSTVLVLCEIPIRTAA